MLKRYRLIIVNSMLLLALGGSLYGKRIEMATVKKTNFLSSLNLTFQDWKSRPDALTPREAELLEPDDQYIRWFDSPNKARTVQLAVIAGHRKRTVHTPGFCMAGSGYETITQQNATFNIDGQEIPISRSIMSQNGRLFIVSYYFTDGSYCTSGLSAYQWHQLWKRFGTGIPFGALVRLFTPVAGDNDQAVKQAEELTDEFAKTTLSPVMRAMRDTKLEAQ